MSVNLEVIVSQRLRAALGPIPAGATIPESPQLLEFEASLERFIPSLLGWRHESLDAFYFAVARRLGPEEAEFGGLALLITDQSWTPMWLRIQLSPGLDAIANLQCKLGERGDGADGLRRTPYGSSAASKLLLGLSDRLGSIDWVYQVNV